MEGVNVLVGVYVVVGVAVGVEVRTVVCVFVKVFVNETGGVGVLEGVPGSTIGLGLKMIVTPDTVGVGMAPSSRGGAMGELIRPPHPAIRAPLKRMVIPTESSFREFISSSQVASMVHSLTYRRVKWENLRKIMGNLKSHLFPGIW
jgi:hypothetical protein